ncbi:MAG: ABC transporter permease [Chitinophagaceae bacterium]|nr:MAG: ABC transporter permease [Chitinophagaceae bacterium]
MIRRSFGIIVSSFRMALLELWKNKLRTFLSLFGITIGIFCIISVMALTSSLEQNLKNEINSIGSNTLYLDKWEYTAGPNDRPWWFYLNRPVPRFAEIKEIKERSPDARYAAFRIQITTEVDYSGNQLSGVKVYGISEDFSGIQPLEYSEGRYFSNAEFDLGTNVIIIGNEIAEQLYGGPAQSLEKEINVKGRRLRIVGVIKKQGKQMIGGWDFDQSVMIPYRYARSIMNEDKADPVIIIKGSETMTSKALKDELTGTVRAIHKLSPTKEDDFSLNDISDLSASISEAFVSVNIGGFAITGLSLIVGMFGVANIMFVSVRERTSQIGLKKAIGAKRRVILTEFLLESTFLSIIGGLIGLLLVFILAKAVSGLLPFPVFISLNSMLVAIGVCIAVGVLAGFIPASQASRLDPVVAIRSK